MSDVRNGVTANKTTARTYPLQDRAAELGVCFEGEVGQECYWLLVIGYWLFVGVIWAGTDNKYCVTDNGL
jgi:hypothetical protein